MRHERKIFFYLSRQRQIFCYPDHDPASSGHCFSLASIRLASLERAPSASGIFRPWRLLSKLVNNTWSQKQKPKVVFLEGFIPKLGVSLVSTSSRLSYNGNDNEAFNDEEEI
ncbi:hypothetical protein C4D60_Mb00t04900 [Musa balbisiana]|uniref:Uncharacterized protein n=1 Tax=Musa balbisiana TaxID=52838 RepID=A0A4S8I5B0_MUSBA|nr:hypothetical protein C4D60_Mb00t04900 [Musa balbisiana]